MRAVFFLNLLNWRNIATLFFLGLPLTGLWTAIEHFIQGPNYFKTRVVVIDAAREITSTTTSGTRIPTRATSTRLNVSYHYVDRHGVTQRGWANLSPEDISPQRRNPGSEALLEVPADPDDGVFRLNRRVEQGLALFLVFGLMSLLSIAQVRWRDQPETRKTWYLCGLSILCLTAAVLWTA